MDHQPKHDTDVSSSSIINRHCTRRFYDKHTNVHQSRSQNDSGDLRGVAGGDGKLGCLCEASVMSVITKHGSTWYIGMAQVPCHRFHTFEKSQYRFQFMKIHIFHHHMVAMCEMHVCLK